MRLVLVLALFVIACLAQDGSLTTTEQLPLGPSKDVSCFHLFPKGREFALGEVGEVYLGFQNHHKSFVNVSHIVGALYHLSDASSTVQAFTEIPYGLSVPPGLEVSVDYYFRPDALLDAMKLGMFATVFYNDGVRNYTTTFFNGTVELVQPSSGSFDVQALFLLLGAVGTIGVVGYIFVNPSDVRGKGPVERGTGATVDRSDFLDHLSKGKKKKKKGKK